jgi:hypothetical protein
MKHEIGWAEPGFLVGQPRTQKVAGFHYLFVEEKHVAESEVGNAMGHLFPKLFAAGASVFGAAGSPPVLAMFIDLEPKMYDVQLEFMVQPGTAAAGEAQVRYVEPALVASIVVGGGIEAVIQSYGPLMEYMNVNGLKCAEGWREWYLFRESDNSANNVSWVQHVAEEA